MTCVTFSTIFALRAGKNSLYCPFPSTHLRPVKYLEKSAQLHAAVPAAAADLKTSVSTDLAKNRRRERAQARAALADDKKRAQKAVDDLEKRLAELEARQAELFEMVAAPSLKVDFAEAGKELSQVRKEIISVETAWEIAVQELEEVLKKLSEIQ